MAKIRKISQSLLCRFVKYHLGYGSKEGISLYELASLSLEKLGYNRGPRESFKQHACANLHVISESPKAPKTTRLRVTVKPQEFVSSDEFLKSYEWRKVRMMAITKYGSRCQCCGATPNDGIRINVDHIKPRRKYPHLALDLDNLQILCEECNHGKGNWDMTDWRNGY